MAKFRRQDQLHSNLKFRVFATEAFRSENLTETAAYLTEVLSEINERFESVSISPKFRFW
jgi:predicted ATP-grasp superfamily ATP-dependent carboligase